ncbi:hypothetical protein F5X99DRAFT_401249 [Biscogniauxia marginata]|nr:hypothetical protein F5X99DRAFT_401249 [Biscogniauxia marginata]
MMQMIGRGSGRSCVMSNHSCAALTLVATNSPDSHHSLYSPIFNRRSLLHFKGSETHNNMAIEVALLLRRGWVLQERLLSRRAVHFAASEVVWECLYCHDCQCFGTVASVSRIPRYCWEPFSTAHRRSIGTIARSCRSSLRWCTNTQGSRSHFRRINSPLSRALPIDPVSSMTATSTFAGLWNSELRIGLSWSASRPLRARWTT